MPHLALFNCGLGICFGIVTQSAINFLIAAMWLFLAVSWMGRTARGRRRVSRR